MHLHKYPPFLFIATVTNAEICSFNSVQNLYKFFRNNIYTQKKTKIISVYLTCFI